MKILHILGARPQFVKYAAVEAAITRRSSQDGLINKLIHTGQHYDYCLSKIFFDELRIKEPEYHLDVGSGKHGQQTALVLQRAEEVLCIERPALVVVYGDTNSTLGGALAAAKLHIPIAHVESGLRSFNKRMPEEINRVLTDHLSSFLFCPSETAVNNLEMEGINLGGHKGMHGAAFSSMPGGCRLPVVFNVGDVMYDTCLHALRIALERSAILTQLSLGVKRYDLLTLHRAENTDDIETLEELILFLNGATAARQVIFPMHPRMAKAYQLTRTKLGGHVKIIPPLGYFDLLMLLNNAGRLFTDSGGMQKEAYWLGVPCITLREETEWVETVSSGWNVLYKNYRGEHQPGIGRRNAYGDGAAAEHIVDVLLKRMNG